MADRTQLGDQTMKPEEKKNYGKQYREKNKEKYDEWRKNNKDYMKKYRAENKEKIAQVDKKYKQKNVEKLKDYQKQYNILNEQKRIEWRKNNPNYMRNYFIHYYYENKEKFLMNTSRRRAAQLQRTPAWLSDDQITSIENLYFQAKMLEIETGIKHHVDHIIPLQGKTVSGLHVPENLRVISAKENLSKNNRYEP